MCMCLQRYLAVSTVHGAEQDITPPENRGYSDAASVDVAKVDAEPGGKGGMMTVWCVRV